MNHGSHGQHLRVPRRLDDPPSFVWEMDVWLIVGLSFVIGIVSGWMFTCSAAGVLCGYRLQRAKAGKTRGYWLHLLYWNLPISLGFKRTPLSCIREWVG